MVPCIGPTLTFGRDLALLSFAVVVVTSFRFGFSVIERGAGWGKVDF